MDIKSIPIDQIQQNENSRVIYKTTDLAELMASMRKDGLLQAVGVRKVAGGYDAVFGNRRILAAKKLGWKTIEAHIVEADTDNDRDILNLVENFKRQNTSVSEDGRIFQKLLDTGLSVKEIGSRLGVTDQRVQTALDVFNEFPDEFKASIVNKASGRSGGRRGKISASTAFTVNNIRKTNSLNRPQMRALLKYAMQDGVGQSQLNSVAPLLKRGVDLSKAIVMAGKIETITLTVQIRKDCVEALERKTEKTIHELCYEVLEANKTLKVTRALRSSSPMSTNARLSKETRKSA